MPGPAGTVSAEECKACEIPANYFMELLITEKPSVAKAIAAAIGGTERGEGFLKAGDYLLSWCMGHLVELAQPDGYGEEYKKWSYETLPIIPKEWKYAVKKETKGQFDVLKKLMSDPEVDAVINACDAGREGELIFRLVYEQAGCQKPIKRLWISSMEERAIREGLEGLRPGSEYEDLYRSALCRQQADWLVGINCTRLFTVLYRAKVLKVGRVQTPTLSMLVEREAEIQNFKKTPYYTVHLLAGGMDAVSGKFEEKGQAEGLSKECKGKEAVVKTVTSEEKGTTPPKLYDLTTLQRDANRIFGFTAKQTLEYTQSLYEKKLCTYPRTDSQYLSDDMEATARDVLTAIGGTFAYLKTDAGTADVPRVMDSSKVTDHHAIIPTVEIEKQDIGELSEGEKKVLSLVAARLVCATAEKYLYQSVKAEMECGGQLFTATGKTVLSEGWKAYDTALREQYKVKADKGEAEEKTLPELSEGMAFGDAECKVAQGSSQPPKHFTEDSLLSSMERAGSEEMGDDVERKGLGTPATRADIIEKLVNDGFVKREKKQMIPTDDGIRLISVLPDSLKSAQLTASWENALVEVAKGERGAEEFMDGICKMVNGIVEAYHAINEEENPWQDGMTLGACPNCGKNILPGRYGAYCAGSCGMDTSHALGKKLEEDEVKRLLSGEKILLKGLKSKKGSTYDAYIKTDGVEPYSYTCKDGSEKSGFRFKFQLEFPKPKQKKKKS